MVWVLARSYYNIRNGTQDYNKTYSKYFPGVVNELYILTNLTGLLDHTKSDCWGVNSSAAIIRLVQETYTSYGK
jgi:hypothetical protein